MEAAICFLLKKRLSMADFATLICLSERNIENHRYRIRKKMGLTRQQELHEVLAGI